MSSIIDDLNPYPSFRPGQRESILAIIDAARAGQKVIEYRGPTGCGKSLVLAVVARVLADEFPRTIYTTPQKALVAQLSTDERLGITALLGRANYHCPKVKSHSAADCPVPAKRRRKTCPRCPYQAQKDEFLGAPLGATTLAKLLIDGSIPRPDIMIIDESQGLETALLDQRSIQLPETVDLGNLEESVAEWVQIARMGVMKYETRLERQFQKIRPDGASDEMAALMGFVDASEAIKTAKSLERMQRICSKAEGVLRTIQDDPEGFAIDPKSRQFKPLYGAEMFANFISAIPLVIMASGTPCTQLLAEEYHKVVAPHPVDVERRRVYYMPVGKMNFQERDRTIGHMAAVIAKLHRTFGRSTLVHCHSFYIADELGRAVYDEGVRCNWSERDRKREEIIELWKNSEDTCFMSVACEEGLDLPGEKYPLNIIAKVPFLPYKSDEWTDRRKARDNKLPADRRWENVSVAQAIQQAAGRCTRGPGDWSETYILDSSFEWFYRKNFKLFEDWFKDALMRKEAIA
jgi:Rad3-related DNA helicase